MNCLRCLTGMTAIRISAWLLLFFMVFNYPNGTNYNKDLIELMFSNNEKMDNYTFNLFEHVRIDNNIFGLKSSKIIIQYIYCDSMSLFSYKNEVIGSSIIEGYRLEDNEKIIAKLNSLNSTKCSMSYLYYITEPDFEEYNSYPNEKVFPMTYNDIYYTAEKDLYESRLLYYSISIYDNLSEDCSDENCLLCEKNY